MRRIVLIACLTVGCAPAPTNKPEQTHETYWRIQVYSGGNVIKTIESTTRPASDDSGHWYVTGTDGRKYILSGTIIAQPLTR